MVFCFWYNSLQCRFHRSCSIDILIPGGHQYVIKPKATPMYFGYSEVMTNMKWSNCASVFSVDDSCFNPWFLLGLFSIVSKKLLDNLPLIGFVLHPQELDASKLLKRAWRVSYQKTSNDSTLQVIACACQPFKCFLISPSSIPSQEISPRSFAAAIDQMASCVKQTNDSNLLGQNILEVRNWPENSEESRCTFCVVDVIWKWLPIQSYVWCKMVWVLNGMLQ